MLRHPAAPQYSYRDTGSNAWKGRCCALPGRSLRRGNTGMRAAREARGLQPCASAVAPVSSSAISRRELLLTQLAAAGLIGGPGRQAQAAAFVDEQVSTAVFRDGAPAVVSIAIVRAKAGVQTREPIGSGIVWDTAGPHVLTNFHVIPPLNGTNVLLEVTVADAVSGVTSTLGARVAGTDSIHDLAVLQLLPRTADASTEAAAGEAGAASSSSSASAASASTPALAPIRLGTSADLRVGQAVYALGCLPSSSSSLEAPALTTTMSVGLLSGLQRSIPSPVGARIYGVLQTDAVINAANSGGPLLDSGGRLVGLNTAVGRSQTVSARGSGVGFALPADLLADVVPKIILYGNPYGKK